VNGGAQPRSGPDDPDEPDDGRGPARPEPGSDAAAFSFNPFEALAGMDLGDLLRSLQTPGPVNWDIARQCAAALAVADPETGEPGAEPPLDRSAAAELEDLVRVAQTHVAAVSGLAEVGALTPRIVTREQWSTLTLDGLRPVIEALSTALVGDGPATAFDPRMLTGDPFAADGDPAMLAGMMRALAPLLFGVQAGSLVGLLAQHALGQHDLPLPLAGAPQLAFALDNVERFAADWEIAPRDLHLSLALREVVRCAPRSVRWVRERLVRLSSEYVSGYELRPEALGDRLADMLPDDLDLGAFDPSRFDFASVDPTDPSTFPAIPELDLDPTRLLDAMRTSGQDPVRAELQRFASVLEGYADTVVAHLGATLSPGTERVDEALRRHRVEHGRHTAFVEQMLGLELDRDAYARGATFCAGVVERAGIEGLNRLWEREAMLPTANEIVAPGLWLARIELDLDED
jgi:putative hydrolase